MSVNWEALKVRGLMQTPALFTLYGGSDPGRNLQNPFEFLQ